ncbi:translation initiation factor IF-2 [Streptomyces sp. P6-2-1]|uniref:translation initiation factor IF-2 n=1 Tax=Streptomyces sp. P6-2-1 TaxID=3422591 RepID=UPI003D367C7D
MTDTQSNAPSRANHDVSGTSYGPPGTPAAPSGVIHVRTRLTANFTVLANALLQRKGSAVTLGVAVYILSLPEGARASITALCAHFTEGEILISRALAELEAEGYLERRRVRLPTGRFRTCTYVHDVPRGTTEPRGRRPRAKEAAPRARTDGAGRARAEGHGHARTETPGRARTETPRRARTETPGRARTETPRRARTETPGRARTETPRRARAEGPPRPRTETRRHPEPHPPPAAADRPPAAPGTDRAPVPLSEIPPAALAVLISLRRLDPRLVLSEREAAALAPGIGRWLATGIDAVRLADTLTANLPDHFLGRPAALLAHRLKDTPLPAPRRRAPDPHSPRPVIHPFQTCDTCDRVFRAPAPGHCRDCREARPPAATA